LKEDDMLIWLLSLVMGGDTGSCINPWGGCRPSGARIDPNG